MYRLYLAAIDMLPGALIFLPVYLILNKTCFHNTGKSILYYLFSCYLSVVYVLVGLPYVLYIRPEMNLNLIPLAGILNDWKNSLLNVLLFIPLGVMLPLLWNKFRQEKNILSFGFLVSLAIELMQTLTYRATDVNDLITNTLGAYLGFLCAKIFLQKRKPIVESKTHELVIVLSVVLLVMFFVYPFVSSALWDWILS